MKEHAYWDGLVEDTLRSVQREASILMWLGFLVYGGGSTMILYLMRETPGLATAAVMFLFQILVLFFGTRKIYPCISGAFRVGLLANRESMPVFERVASALEGKDGPASRLERKLDQAVLDIRETGDRIHGEVKRLADTMERPIRPPPPSGAFDPPVSVENNGGKGKSSGQDGD